MSTETNDNTIRIYSNKKKYLTFEELLELSRNSKNKISGGIDWHDKQKAEQFASFKDKIIAVVDEVGRPPYYSSKVRRKQLPNIRFLEVYLPSGNYKKRY